VGVVLVTGCRSGFGLRIAIEAARRGHTVYAGLRDLSAAGPLLADTAGLALHPVQLDVTDAAQREAAVARILAEQGRLDGLVNNAGQALTGFLEQVDDDELRALFELNVFAVWALTRAALPAMREQRSGRVVMVGSVSGRVGMPGLGAYAATKFALEGMSEAWRHELAPFGVSVAIVEPGPYATDLWDRNRRACRNAADATSPYAPLVERIERFTRERVEPAAGDPNDVAERVCDLLEGPSPAFRHPMGPTARLRTRFAAMAPFGLVEWAVERTLGLRSIVTPKP
jgi:NAD(P)-dependent dehydrogenase (short-subunit alcohol dehydrogenase family)